MLITLFGISNISDEIQLNNRFISAHEYLEKNTEVKRLVHSQNLSLQENRELVSLQSNDRWNGKQSPPSEQKAESEKPKFDPDKPYTVVQPIEGKIEDGYRFKGGDPSKKENWVKDFNPDLFLIDTECFDFDGKFIGYSNQKYPNSPDLKTLSDKELIILAKGITKKAEASRNDCYFIKDFKSGHIALSVFKTLSYFALIIFSLYGVRKWAKWVFKE